MAAETFARYLKRKRLEQAAAKGEDFTQQDMVEYLRRLIDNPLFTIDAKVYGYWEQEKREPKTAVQTLIREALGK